MKAETTSSDSVRIPTPVEGIAVRVRRYNRDRAVIMHPKDFARLEALDHIHTLIAVPDEFKISDAARTAHIESITPGEPIEDRDELRRLFP
jgi:hypothetical protein